MTTLLGISVVDVQHWDRNKLYGYVKQMVIDEGEDDEKLVDDFNIKIMANLIGKLLADGHFQYRTYSPPSIRITNADSANQKPIVWITGEDGTMNYPTKSGEHPRVHQQSCFVCRQYHLGSINTQWKCQ